MAFRYPTNRTYLEAAAAGEINGITPLFRSRNPLTAKDQLATLYAIVLPDSLPISSIRLIVQPYRDNRAPFGMPVEVGKGNKLDDRCEVELPALPAED